MADVAGHVAQIVAFADVDAVVAQDVGIFRVSKPGRAHSEGRFGFSAIGIGADSTIGQLMDVKSDRSHMLERVMWNAFDAKVQAEIMVDKAITIFEPRTV